MIEVTTTASPQIKKRPLIPSGIKGRHNVVPPFFMKTSQSSSHSVNLITEAISWQTATYHLDLSCVVIGY